MDTEDILKISEWMKDQTIFITGVSGFIGKVLLWKLLKSCSNLRKVYVLLRPKKGKSTEERLNELLSVEIFKEMKEKTPVIFKKIKAIEGDLCMVRLGLQDLDWQLLEKEVTTVFHVAASIRFDDSLQKAIFANTRSTKYALSLAKKMKNLKAFVHVSTAYTNCRFLHIPEKVILTDFDPEKMITIAEKFGEHELEVLSQNLLKDYPNTYIFTKNLAEDLVFKSRHDVPVVIVRPSIVVSSVKEPSPGWCDNLSSILALMGAGGKGVCRLHYGPSDIILDFITVDACVNAMIIAAWCRDSCFYTKAKKNFVFNVTDFRYSIGYFGKQFCNLSYQYPLKNQLWKAFVVYQSSSLLFHIFTFLLHILPGFILDGALKISGKKPMLMKIYRKLYMVSINLKPFVSNAFNFDTSNFRLLDKLVPKEEKEIFFTNFFQQTTEEKYFADSLIGGRGVVGDPPEISKSDIKHVHRLYWIDLIFRIVLFGLFIWILPLKFAFEWSVFKMIKLRDSIIEE